ANGSRRRLEAAAVRMTAFAALRLVMLSSACVEHVFVVLYQKAARARSMSGNRRSDGAHSNGRLARGDMDPLLADRLAMARDPDGAAAALVAPPLSRAGIGDRCGAAGPCDGGSGGVAVRSSLTRSFRGGSRGHVRAHVGRAGLGMVAIRATAAAAR